jgi:hypothetical protein
MPATDIEKLIVSLEARTKEYEKALARAQGQTVSQLRKMEKQAESFATRFDKKLSGFGAGLKAGAAAAAVTAFSAAIKTAVADAAKIGDVADKIGITTDKLQELAYGAVQADIGFDDLNKNLSMFSKRLGEAQNGSGELFQLMEANGFDKQSQKAMSLSQALDVVADMIRNAKTEQDQMVIATTAFGKSGGDMIEMLRGGSQALDDYGKAAGDAGAKIDEHLIRKAQELDDKWAAVMQSLKTTTQEATIFIVGEFQKTFSAYDEMARALKEGDLTTFLFGGNDSALRQLVGAAPTPAVNPPRVFPRRNTGPATVIPDADADKKAATAARDKAKADREAAKAAEHRKRFIADVTELLDEEWQATTKANIAITDTLNEQQLEKINALRDSLQSVAELGVDAFERWAFGGEKLKVVLKDVAQQLASAAIQAAIFGQGPLAGLFGGGGGLFGALFGGGAITSLYHKGGVVGSAGGMSRAVNPAIFAGAPRMHGGGVAGLKSGEVPAILQKGEMVLPRGASAGSGVAVNFNINAEGADRLAIATLRADLSKMASNIRETVRQTVSTEYSRNPRFVN